MQTLSSPQHCGRLLAGSLVTRIGLLTISFLVIRVLSTPNCAKLSIVCEPYCYIRRDPPTAVQSYTNTEYRPF